MQGLAAAGHTDIQAYSAGFRVVGCTESTDARDNTRTIHTTSDQGVAIYWLGGNRVADDYGDFYDGSWDDQANPKDELGANGLNTLIATNFPFTGCEDDGTEESSLALGNSSVRNGHPHSSRPISSSVITASSERRPMYGLSGLFRVVAATLPGAPTGLTATADGETGIDLSWTAPGDDGGGDITGYRIEVSEDGGSAWTDLVADTGSADTTHPHTGLSAGSTRHYRVSAINPVGTGTPSGVVYTTTVLSDALVSNTGQSGDPDVTEAIGDQDRTHSQGFETGSNPEGYRLSTVGVYVADADLGTGEAFTVHIHAADGAGGLGAVAYTLTSPGVYTANAVNVFTAPVGAALEADTAYHVVFEGAGDAATDFVLGVSASDGEDLGSAGGWNIEDGRRFQGSVASAGTNFQVSVNGSPIPTEVPANWGLVPAGLSAGDTFRLLFLSSTKRNATSSDIEDYNAFVQGRAAAGHADIQEYSAGFRVLGCTEATDARDNTRTIHTTSDQGEPIYWLGGAKLADDYGDFYDGSWDDQANDKDESGANGPDTSQSANFPFTGCDDDGTEEVTSSGSRALGNSSVRVAHPHSSRPISSSVSAASGNTRPMYGLSELFRVTTAAATVPGAPTGLTATADGETGIDLSWTAPADDGGADITGYRIEVSEDGGSAWADRVADTNSTGTIHSHTGLSAGSTRHYRVSAINAVGTGLPSDVVGATTAAADMLVGNTGQIQESTEAIGDQDRTHSQGFETGSNPGGYSLASVGVYVADADLGAGETFTVHIHAADGAGGLGALAYTLASPGSYTANAVNVFTAPAGAALEADTAYHVVFEGTGDAATDFVLGVSASDGEDGGSRLGWEIEDGRRFEGSVSSAGGSYQVSVNGAAVTEVYSTWSLVPAGLSAGDTFRLLFLSSTKRNGASPDIEVYNAFVQDLAAAGHADIRAYGAGFRVVGCTAATDARDNTRTTGKGVPIYWLGAPGWPMTTGTSTTVPGTTRPTTGTSPATTARIPPSWTTTP